MTTAFVPVTDTVHPDEKAWRLKEINLPRMVGKAQEMHRIQFVWVARNGVVMEWSQDLGRSDGYTSPGLDIPAIWEHTVGELFDIAEEARLGNNYWQRWTAEQESESTLIPDWINQVDEQSKIIRNQSVFGPGGHRQRNGFPLKEVLRKGNK